MPSGRAGSPVPRLVTLTTDLGWAYAAQMKAVLYRSLPPGTVVDLAHDLRPHAIDEARFLWRYLAERYPAGTVHVAIVDPGVGSPRAPVALAAKDGSFLLGPDNGVLDDLAGVLGARAGVRLDPRRVPGSYGPGVTFDGRDLFAPAAVALALGRPIGSLGRAYRPPRRPRVGPVRTSGGADGALSHIDRFGNLITNIPTDWLPARRGRVEVTLSRMAPRTARIVRTYADLDEGVLGLLGSSFGLLELAHREASAADRLGASVGDPVRMRWVPAAGKR